MAATREGRGEVMRLLLDGVQVRNTLVRCSVDLCNTVGETALHLAASRGDAHLCSLLLSSRASPCARDALGLTPLHHSVSSSNTELISLLVEKGAQVEAHAANGQTPMQQCAAAIAALARAHQRRHMTEAEALEEGEHILVMEVLIEQGAVMAETDRHFKLGVPEELRPAVHINAERARRQAIISGLAE